MLHNYQFAMTSCLFVKLYPDLINLLTFSKAEHCEIINNNNINNKTRKHCKHQHKLALVMF